MKKQLFIYFVITLFFSLNIYSQAPRGFYAAAGLYQASLKSSDLLTEKPSPGFYAGIDFNFGYHETYNYQFEAVYNESTLNLKTVDESYTQVGTSKYKYSNLEFGFYFNYYVIKPDEDKFYLGPQIGFFAQIVDPLSPSKGRDVTYENYLPYLLDESALQDSSPFNYGTGFGLTGGYNNFRFDLRYSLGFENLLSAVETESRNENRIYTGPALEGTVSSISFGISYNFFQLHKK